MPEDENKGCLSGGRGGPSCGGERTSVGVRPSTGWGLLWGRGNFSGGEALHESGGFCGGKGTTVGVRPSIGVGPPVGEGEPLWG